MRVEIEANLPLDDAVDQQTDDGEHRQGGNPFRFLEPHGGDRRGVLNPTKTRFHGRILVLIGLKNLCIRPPLRAYRRGEDGPPIIFLWVTQALDLDHHAIARLGRGWVRLRGPSSTGAACTAGLCHDAIADRVIPPGPRPAPAASWPPAFILSYGRVGV